MQHNQTRNYLQDAAFQPLFVEELGWDYHTQALTVTVVDTEYTLAAIAEKRGMVVFRCTATENAPLPNYATRRAIQRHVATSVHEHVIIYTDAEETTQLWQWVRREECYLDPVFYDPEFYRPFRCDEIENPLKS